MSGTIYLLHFSSKLHHAGHYLGYTDDRPGRLERHLSRDGARIVRAAIDAGLGIELARTWGPGVDRTLERILKNRKQNSIYCPICNGTQALEKGLYIRGEYLWIEKKTGKAIIPKPWRPRGK